MFVIGLTGGIGVGKTVAAHILEGFGATVINADMVGHEMYLKGTSGRVAIVKEFGYSVLDDEGEVDRGKLSEIVFSDSDRLKRLNAIMHPRIYQRIEERISELRTINVGVVVVEAALLIEANWSTLVDEVWVVVSTPEQVKRNLSRRSSLSPATAAKRISAQIPQGELTKHADAVLQNSGTVSQLRIALEKAWANRVSDRVGS